MGLEVVSDFSAERVSENNFVELFGHLFEGFEFLAFSTFSEENSGNSVGIHKGLDFFDVAQLSGGWGGFLLQPADNGGLSSSSVIFGGLTVNEEFKSGVSRHSEFRS